MAKKIIPKLKRKKKKWILIKAPKLFDERDLGESYVQSEEQLLGKRIKTSLSQIGGPIKKKNISILFEVKQAINNIGYAEVIGYEVSPTTIKRSVRKGKTRIDDSILLKTQDGFTIRLKPFILTNSTTTKSVSTKIKAITNSVLKELISSKTIIQVFEALIKSETQLTIKNKIKKIFPVGKVEIRQAKVEKEGKWAKARKESKKEEKEDTPVKKT